MTSTRRTRVPRAPGSRRAAAALLVTVALAAADCGGSGSASSGAANSILTIGTTNYIDTLNPFIGIEP